MDSAVYRRVACFAHQRFADIADNIFNLRSTSSASTAKSGCVLLMSSGHRNFSLRSSVRSIRRIIQLTNYDFRSKYLGSHLGLFWSFLQPLLTLAVLCFVLQVGFKTGSVGNYPFIMWLMAGIIPWFFISEGLSNSSGAIVENSFLIKKVVFDVHLLPIIKIISALYVHAFFIVLLLLVFLFQGNSPCRYWLQLIYYLSSSIVLVMGISLLTSAAVAFVSDLKPVIAMFLQLGFWLTPIFWSHHAVAKNYRYLIKLNPFFYIVTGYRDSMIDHVWLWERPLLTIYFWIFTVLVLITGILAFRRLQSQFADVV